MLAESMGLIAAAGNGGPSWEAIVVAALGSSAVGAIVGGYVTTRTRGTIERDEAWRTRLVDAADSFLAQLGRTVNAIPHSWLAAVEEGEASLRDEEDRTPEAEAAAAAFAEEKGQLLPLMSRIELLFGPDAAEPAREAVRIVVNAGEVFTGAAWIRHDVSRYGALGLGVSGATPLDAEDFDPDDDGSVALWTRALLESVETHRRRVLQACSLQVNSRHPSQMAQRRTSAYRPDAT
jgi:hypothetical protein